MRRERAGLVVIGVSGSTGKTSTKDLLAAALPPGDAFASPESYNNEFGLPITLLNAPAPAHVVVAEMGERFPGDVAFLCEIAQPQFGIVTNVGLAHAEHLGGPEGIARVLAELHARWSGRAHLRWPWLRPVGAAIDIVESLYAGSWPALAARQDLTPRVRDLTGRLVGKVKQSEQAMGRAGPLTLAHGDASLANMRTGSAAEIALLDWEDVSAAPGIAD